MSSVTLTFDLWPPKSIGCILSSRLTCFCKFDKEICNGLVSMVFTSLFPYMSLMTWPLTFKINRVHPLTMVNMFAKSDKENPQRLSLYCVHKLISIDVHCYLDIWPLTPKIKTVHPLITVNMFAKSDKENPQRLSLYGVHKLISIDVQCDLDLWPLTSKINRVHPLITVIMFLQVWQRNMQRFSLYGVQKRDYQESVTIGQTDARTHRQTPDKVIPMCRYALQATQ